MFIYNLIRTNRDIGNTDDPQFNKSRGHHDWRNYVPEDIVEVWKDLTVESRVMIYLTANKYANLER